MPAYTRSAAAASTSSSSSSSSSPSSSAPIAATPVATPSTMDDAIDRLVDMEMDAPPTDATSSSAAAADAPAVTSAAPGLAASQHAPQPSLEELLDTYVSDSKKKTTAYILLAAKAPVDDPSLLHAKKTLDDLDAKITLIRRTLKQKTGSSVVRSSSTSGTMPFSFINQIPVFQIRGQTTTNGTSTVFKSVDHFIRKFEKTMALGDVDLDAQWSKYLNFAMQGDDVDMWFQSKMKHLKMTWSAAKNMLVEKFAFKDNTTSAVLALASLRQKKGESLLKFSLRLQALSDQAKWSDGPILAIISLKALPTKLRNNVISAHQAKSDGSNLPQSSDEVIRIATRIQIQRKSFRPHDDDDSDDESDSSTSRPRKRSRNRRSPKKAGL